MAGYLTRTAEATRRAEAQGVRTPHGHQHGAQGCNGQSAAKRPRATLPAAAMAGALLLAGCADTLEGARGPVFYACDGGRVAAVYAASTPARVTLTAGGGVITLTQVPAASGVQFAGAGYARAPDGTGITGTAIFHTKGDAGVLGLVGSDPVTCRPLW